MTGGRHLIDQWLQISLHTLRMEGDLCGQGVRRGDSVISIHTLRMEGDPFNLYLTNLSSISIHTLRMEGDTQYLLEYKEQRISIHTLRMEGDLTQPNLFGWHT